MELDGLDNFEQIGEGGFGAVYRATDESHGRRVAVKILHDAPDDAGQRRFDRERRAMGTLSGHPNIAVVHQSGVDERGRLYLVMEYLSGGSMADQMTVGPMDESALVDIGLALTDALARAHDLGVLHLDLKPENILLSEFGVPKVVDFGISSFVNDQQTATIRATPAYAAPEVLDGHTPGPAADVYGLGATLFALIEGAAPYGGSDTGALSVIRAIATGPVPTVTRDDVSPGLVQLLDECMATDPADRPESMAVVGERLAAIRAADAPDLAARSEPETPSAATMIVGTNPATPAAAAVPSPPANRGNTPGHSPTGSAPQPTRRTGVLIGVLALIALVVIVGVVSTRGGDSNDDPSTSADQPTTTGETAQTTAVATTAAPATTTAPTTAAPTTAPPTTATATTVTPTTSPPTGPTADNAFWSTDVRNNQAVDDTVVLAAGSRTLCLNWSYGGLPRGAPLSVLWTVDGVSVPEYNFEGANGGDVTGQFWACANNPSLPAGIYEVTWQVQGDRIFTHGFVVGPTRGTTVRVTNRTGAPICGVTLDPLGTSTTGINRLPSPIADGSVFPIGVSAGTWGLAATDCSGNPIDEFFVDTTINTDVDAVLR